MHETRCVLLGTRFERYVLEQCNCYGTLPHYLHHTHVPVHVTKVRVLL